ncbi:hypothetical protein OVA24_11085 [Luteolibacter sp. SL250]|uniref:hypothetical protein n=1 Tax=Luteolibacter sp. SL250 TaxID=2995170 RepID=UPI00226DFC64|nr:hypothetical protein [Luteolibacter sp. SL250]WAC17787.1 hypothetical protein OVA24_11085 [Luteolibacter sp. SL250]
MKYYPERLDPVSQTPHDWEKRYHDLLGERLKTDAPFFARIIICPAFSGESCMRLHGKGDEQRCFDQTESFFITHTTADKSIWYSMPENNETADKRDVKVSTRTAAIPPPIAKRICRLFQRFLLLPKNDFPGGGLDGITYEFATPSSKGEAWCPGAPHLAGLFAELGKQMIDYCESPSDEKRAGFLKDIETKTAAIEERFPPEPDR